MLKSCRCSPLSAALARAKVLFRGAVSVSSPDVTTTPHGCWRFARFGKRQNVRFGQGKKALKFSTPGIQAAGAGSGNRTRIFSLEGCCSTTELYPHSHQLALVGAACRDPLREPRKTARAAGPVAGPTAPLAAAMVEGAGFEPAYAKRTDLQSVSFNHSDTPPHPLFGGRPNAVPNATPSNVLVRQRHGRPYESRGGVCQRRAVPLAGKFLRGTIGDATKRQGSHAATTSLSRDRASCKQRR